MIKINKQFKNFSRTDSLLVDARVQGEVANSRVEEGNVQDSQRFPVSKSGSSHSM